jgi:hypothetical protein
MMRAMHRAGCEIDKERLAGIENFTGSVELHPKLTH